jgi:hypothetical protein
MNQAETNKIFEDRINEINGEILTGNIGEHRRKYLLIRKEEASLMLSAFNTYWINKEWEKKREESIFAEHVQLWNNTIVVTIISPEEAREMIESGKAKRINHLAIRLVEKW